MNPIPLTAWQRAEIIERVAEGFSSRAKQTLDTALPDEYLLELWDLDFPGEPLPQPDAARYAQLVARLNVLKASGLPARELWGLTARLQQEIEEIKNHFAGLTPKVSETDNTQASRLRSYEEAA